MQRQGHRNPLATGSNTVSLLRTSLFVLTVAIIAAGAFAWRVVGDGSAVAAPAIYVALGASDAVGVGATRPQREGWVPLVFAELPEGAQLVNLGVSGATLGQVLDGQLPPALDAGPRWVTIWPGPNDLRAGVDLDLFTAQLDTLLERLTSMERGRQRPTIAVLNLPDLRAVPVFARGDRVALDTRVREWNAAITASVARAGEGVILIDLYASWDELAAHPEYVSADGFHPSNAGYRRIADIVLDELRRRGALS